MKNIKLLITMLALFASSFTASAQTPQKIGYINTGELISIMPETKEADKNLQAMATMLETQLKTMTTEYQTKVAAFQTQEQSMSDSMKDVKIKEIQDLEKRIQDFQQKAQLDIQKKQEEVYAPVIKKAEDAVKIVAKENGYTYVLDSSKGMLIEMPASDDLLPLVKKKLNITTPAPAKPAAPAKK